MLVNSTSRGSQIEISPIRRMSLTWCLLVVSTFGLLFLISVGFKLNQSSIGAWDQRVGVIPARGILLGTPRAIRSDEWVVNTPWMLSQANQTPPFPRYNSSIGVADAPLLSNMPVRHFTLAFKPQFWGFFFLSTERGFAWFWSYRFFGTLAGLFVLLHLLTRGDLILSLTGTLWILFSSPTQWWFSNVLADLLVSFLWVTACAALLFASSRRSHIVLSAIGTALFGGSFALTIYPPFQVSLGYLSVAILVTILLKEYEMRWWTTLRSFKLVALSLATAVIVVALAWYLIDTAPTIRLSLETAYPGKRISLGGGMSLARYFSGFFDEFISDDRFPLPWGNVCESSAFILLWPIACIRLLVSAYKSPRCAYSQLPLGLLVVFLTGWQFFGLSEVLAKVTLLSFVPSSRATIALGIASILICILSASSPVSSGRSRYSQAVAAGFGVMFFVVWLSGSLNDLTGIKFSTQETIIAATCAGLLGTAIYGGFKKLLASVILFAVVLPGALINPVAQGMDPLIKRKLAERIKEFSSKDPQAKWASFGDVSTTQLVVATGASVINGAKFMPDLEALHRFDTEKRAENIYNRYSHFALVAGAPGSSPKFSSPHADVVVLEVDPCAPQFTQLGVKFYTFSKGSYSAGLPGCLEKVFGATESRDNIVIAVRKSESGQ